MKSKIIFKSFWAKSIDDAPHGISKRKYRLQKYFVSQKIGILRKKLQTKKLLSNVWPLIDLECTKSYVRSKILKLKVFHRMNFFGCHGPFFGKWLNCSKHHLSRFVMKTDNKNVIIETMMTIAQSGVPDRLRVIRFNSFLYIYDHFI